MALRIAKQGNAVHVFAQTNTAPAIVEFRTDPAPGTTIEVVALEGGGTRLGPERFDLFRALSDEYRDRLLEKGVTAVGFREDGIADADRVRAMFETFLASDMADLPQH